MLFAEPIPDTRDGETMKSAPHSPRGRRRVRAIHGMCAVHGRDGNRIRRGDGKKTRRFGCGVTDGPEEAAAHRKTNPVQLPLNEL
jgi:hypothetical protein